MLLSGVKARNRCLWCEGRRVEEGAVDLAGDVAFEAPDDLLLAFALRRPRLDVLLGASTPSNPSDCDPPLRPVGVAVEPVAHHPAR